MQKELRKGESRLSPWLSTVSALPIVLTVLMISAFSPARSSAKPLPPHDLTLLFKRFSVLETEYESGKWDRALLSADQIRTEFDKMLPQLGQVIKTDIAGSFSFLMDKIRLSILGRDSEETGKYYIVLQMMLFHIMDAYEYRVPPALIIIQKYIEEAMQAWKKGDISNVRGEMQEIEIFFEKAEELLSTKGVRSEDILRFKAAMERIHALSARGNVSDMESSLVELKNLSEAFVSMYH